MARIGRHRSSTRRSREGGHSDGRIRLPPWLFYLLVALTAAGAIALVGWAMFNPPTT